MARWKTFLSNEHVTVSWEFAKRYLKDSQTLSLRSNIMWCADKQMKKYEALSITPLQLVQSNM